MEKESKEPSVEGLQARIRKLEASQNSLRWVVNLTLLTAIFLTLSAWYYLFRQTSFARRQVENAEQVVAAYQTQQAPRNQAFVNLLQGYARTNADFAPILLRHGVAAPGAKATGDGDAAPWQGPPLPAAE